jgi:hypothetical protein
MPSSTATIQRQDRARRETRFIRRQVKNPVAHFFGGADAAQGDPTVDAVEVTFLIAAEPRTSPRSRFSRFPPFKSSN